MDHKSNINIAAHVASVKEQTLADVRNQILSEIEEQYLRLLLIRHQGSVTNAAETASVSTSYLRRLIKKRGIDPNQYREKKNSPSKTKIGSCRCAY